MSVTSILAARERHMTNATASPPEDARRARVVEQAVRVLQDEIAVLRGLERRAERRRQARAATAEFTARALRKFELRQAMKHLTVTIDRELFRELGSRALQTLHGEASSALERKLELIWQSGCSEVE